MKTYKHIFDEVLKEENIRQCFHDAAKRKTTRPEVARVLKEEREVGNDRPDPQCLQEHVKALQKILEEETFKPPEHRKQLINEYSCGKVREIIKPEYQYEPDEATGWLVTAFIFAVLLPFFGIAFGVMVWSQKIKLDNGSKVYKYKETHRYLGLVATVVAIISVFIWKFAVYN